MHLYFHLFFLGIIETSSFFYIAKNLIIDYCIYAKKRFQWRQFLNFFFFLS